MRQHLKHSTGCSRAVNHEYGEKHKTAVGNRRVSIYVLQVGLNTGGKCAIDNSDAYHNQEYPAESLCSLGHEEHCYAETSVASEFHKHSGVKHGHCGRRRSMTVGTPCVEREHCTKHTESHKS